MYPKSLSFFFLVLWKSSHLDFQAGDALDLWLLHTSAALHTSLFAIKHQNMYSSFQPRATSRLETEARRSERLSLCLFRTSVWVFLPFSGFWPCLLLKQEARRLPPLLRCHVNGKFHTQWQLAHVFRCFGSQSCHYT